MKAKLKSFLKRWPKLYDFLKKTYSVFSSVHYRLIMPLLGTKLEERRWRSRGIEEIEKEFSNLNHPHRILLLEKIKNFQPFLSVLEIGCGWGPNLILLAKQFPKAEIKGIDINPLSVEEGNKYLKKEGISNVELLVGKADELQAIPDKSFDIVFTDALLIYIGPDKIMKVVKEMIRITRRALILIEWHSFEPSPKVSYAFGVCHSGCWKRDYVALLKHFVPEAKIHVTRFRKAQWPDKNWCELGALIEVVML